MIMLMSGTKSIHKKVVEFEDKWFQKEIHIAELKFDLQNTGHKVHLSLDEFKERKKVKGWYKFMVTCAMCFMVILLSPKVQD